MHRPTQPKDRAHVVADEDDGAALSCHVLHLAQALLLELGVAHRQHLIHEQNLRLQVRRHRESQADLHAAGVALDRGIDELLDTREVHDLVELGGDLPAAHPENRAVEVDVLAAGQLRVEAGAGLQET